MILRLQDVMQAVEYSRKVILQRSILLWRCKDSLFLCFFCVELYIVSLEVRRRDAGHDALWSMWSVSVLRTALADVVNVKEHVGHVSFVLTLCDSPGGQCAEATGAGLPCRQLSCPEAALHVVAGHGGKHRVSKRPMVA